MIIVIEGADLVGKTTVINRLAAEIQNSIPLKLEVVIDLDSKCVADIEKAINHTAYSIMSKDVDKIWLVDRFIVSALIYSKYLNRPTKLSVKDIIDRDYTIIILGTFETVLVERFTKRHDKHFSIDEIQTLNKLFFNFYTLNLLEINNLHYLINNTQDDLDRIIRYVKKLIMYKTDYDK